MYRKNGFQNVSCFVFEQGIVFDCIAFNKGKLAKCLVVGTHIC